MTAMMSELKMMEADAKVNVDGCPIEERISKALVLDVELEDDLDIVEAVDELVIIPTCRQRFPIPFYNSNGVSLNLESIS